ncbi:MAG: ABC transporter permease subunit [Stellaceae bacterium]
MTAAPFDRSFGGWAPGRPRTLALVFWLFGGILLAFIAIPLFGLAALPSGADLLRVAAEPAVEEAIALSLEAAFLTVACAALFGVPLAYVLARGTFPGKGALAALIDVPLAVPHTVAGIALLSVFGRRGVLGIPAEALFGIRFWGTFAGIIAAMLFVSAPYTVSAARIGFEGVDPRLEKVARTLGLGPWRTFWRVTLPLARRSILTGLVLTYARSISEFAAVAILAYYPMTAPIKVYELFLRVGLGEAAAMAVLLMIVCLALFILFRQLAYGSGVPAGQGR